MIIETVFSMLTRTSRFKQQTHRAWAYFTAYAFCLVRLQPIFAGAHLDFYRHLQRQGLAHLAGD